MGEMEGAGGLGVVPRGGGGDGADARGGGAESEEPGPGSRRQGRRGRPGGQG